MPIERAFAFSDLFSLVRAGSAWRFNEAGVLTEVAANGLRVDWDPATLQPRGALVEEAATNGVQNPRCEGAVAGSPGTRPTGWGFVGGPGIAQQIAGIGVEDGFPYVDVRYAGTPSSSGGITALFSVAGTNAPAALVGQVWRATLRARLVAGSLTNLGAVTIVLDEYNGTTFLNGSSAGYALAAGPIRSTQGEVTRTLTMATTNQVLANWRAGVTSGQPIDVTVRFAALQLVQTGVQPSDIFPPAGTPGASTRAADDFAFLDIGAFYNAAAGTFVIDWTPGQTTSPGNRGLLTLDDGTANNRLRLFMQPAGTAPRLAVTSDGVSVVPGTSAGAVTALARSTLRFSYGPAGYLMSVNGAAPVAVAGALPLNVSRCLLGRGAPASEYLNGWLGPRLEYFPVQYTDTPAADGLTIRTR